ncbi:MAG: carbohydrate kinase, partial [Firmicutes bacterium]|nr:carbohydrate kinase [Bacillota bacterium]
SGAEAISCGVVESGKMMLQLGSSVYMILGTDTLVDDEQLWREQFIVPGLCDISAGTNTAGSLTKWLRDELFPDAVAAENAGGENAYQAMLKGAADIPPGSNGLVTLPYFAGERTPVNDPDARGVFFGLTLQHTRAHLYRSALEAVGYSIAQQIRIMETHPEVRIDRIIAAGGGAENPLWMQIIADILGKEIATPEVTVGACYGDAMMAALGVKYEGFEDYASLTRVIRAGRTYTPDPQAHEAYKKYQAVYDALYGATKDLAHKLAL